MPSDMSRSQDKQANHLLDQATLRSLVAWHREYNPEWDNRPDDYVDAGIVGWGLSRRLGLFRRGAIKAYLGVQHVDPSKAGWAIVDAPQARFFLSLFVSGQCVTLRTFLMMAAALDALVSFLDFMQPDWKLPQK